MDEDMIDPALSSDSSRTMAPAHARNGHVHDKDDDDDDDPVIGTYNILLKPTLTANRKIMVLEYPNKSDGKKHPRAPLELRMKPATGMVELDYPLDYNTSYDRNKGLNWGTNLHKSMEAKKGGSHGLAGGFGVGAPPTRAARAGRGGAGDEILDMGMEWSEALRRDYVLRTQTLGGQKPNADMESKYMVGVFSGGNIHLTPASSLVHLRPQHHHIDATTEQERRAAPAPATTTAAKDAARAIHMTIKQTNSGGDEEIVVETMADRLKKVQMEGWRRMRYMHDEAADSWAAAEEALHLQDHSVAAGKQPEGASAAAAADHLVDKVAVLRTAWDEDGMLETTSGVSRESMVKVEISDDEPASSASKTKGKGKAVENGTSSGSKPRTIRGKRTTATASRTKAGPSSASQDD